MKRLFCSIISNVCFSYFYYKFLIKIDFILNFVEKFHLRNELQIPTKYYFGISKSWVDFKGAWLCQLSVIIATDSRTLNNVHNCPSRYFPSSECFLILVLIWPWHSGTKSYQTVLVFQMCFEWMYAKTLN